MLISKNENSNWEYGTPILTKSITTQIVDGHYSGTMYGFPFGESRNVELQIYDDGRHNLNLRPLINDLQE